MSGPLNELRDELGWRIERMISIQSQAYPDHWSSDDKRDMAMRHLGLKLTEVHRISETEIVA